MALPNIELCAVLFLNLCSTFTRAGAKAIGGDLTKLKKMTRFARFFSFAPPFFPLIGAFTSMYCRPTMPAIAPSTLSVSHCALFPSLLGSHFGTAQLST